MTGSSTSRVRSYIFDLDGTLFHTRDLVGLAYMHVGVDMPEDAWGKPASQWMPQLYGAKWKYLHQCKTKRYLELLKRMPPKRTSAASAMIELKNMGIEAYVITGASREAAHALLAEFQPYHYRLIGTSCDRSAKLTKVRMVTRRAADVVYVDDDIDTCIAMAAHGYRVVRYHQDMTKEEVLQWARSSSLPDAVND